MMNLRILKDFLPVIASQYRLDPTHAHGLSHWGRVLENGFKLAEREGGDPAVISLFAIFHDACRRNQSWDPGHGNRGANLALSLLSNHPLVDAHQLQILVSACRGHTDGKTQADTTIQVCWDADRLDLARVGIMPQPNKLCTPTAMESSTLEWANRRALSDFSPEFVQQEWLPIFVT